MLGLMAFSQFLTQTHLPIGSPAETKASPISQDASLSRVSSALNHPVGRGSPNAELPILGSKK